MFGSPQKKFLKAASEGNVAILENFCDNYIPDDFSVDVRDEKGRTALRLAVESNIPEAVRLLLSRKADCEMSDSDDAAPLFVAVKAGQTEIAKMLLEAGANPNTHTNEYAYPLHWAAYNGDIDIVKLLVKKGADINALSKKEERTPLYYAILANRGNVAEYLIGSGARWDIPGTDGKTDADSASASNTRIAKMIEDAKARSGGTTDPKPAAPAPVAEDSESWKLMGASKAAHIGVYPDLNRKITEIFNFATRERLIITENLKTGAETMGASEKFASLTDEAVARATEAFKQLGGDSADRSGKKSFNL